jgi:hypothetical protein
VSGALCALLAGATPSRYSVTIANFSGTGQIFGYNPSSAPPGSISSTAFKTTTINNVSNQTVASGSPTDIALVLDGSLTQSYFSALVVERTDGTVKRYATAAASFVVFGGGTLSAWTWDSNDPCWTATGTKIMLLYP